MKPDRDTSGTYDWDKVWDDLDLKNEHTLSYEELNKLIEYCEKDETIGQGKSVLITKLKNIKEELDEPAIVGMLIQIKGEE